MPSPQASAPARPLFSPKNAFSLEGMSLEDHGQRPTTTTIARGEATAGPPAASRLSDSAAKRATVGTTAAAAAAAAAAASPEVEAPPAAGGAVAPQDSDSLAIDTSTSRAVQSSNRFRTSSPITRRLCNGCGTLCRGFWCLVLLAIVALVLLLVVWHFSTRPICHWSRVSSNFRGACDALSTLNEQWYEPAFGGWKGMEFWGSAVALHSAVNFMNATGSREFRGLLGHIHFLWPAPTVLLKSFGSFDDPLWWAEAYLAAFRLTNEKRYLSSAQSIFDRVFESAWDTGTCGGGLWWSDARGYKNAITNSLAILVASELYLANGDEQYLQNSEKVWAWFKASGMINAKNLVNDGLEMETDRTCRNNGETTWTYNQGILVAALTSLHRAQLKAQRSALSSFIGMEAAEKEGVSLLNKPFLPAVASRDQSESDRSRGLDDFLWRTPRLELDEDVNTELDLTNAKLESHVAGPSEGDNSNEDLGELSGRRMSSAKFVNDLLERQTLSGMDGLPGRLDTDEEDLLTRATEIAEATIDDLALAFADGVMREPVITNNDQASFKGIFARSLVTLIEALETPRSPPPPIAASPLSPMLTSNSPSTGTADVGRASLLTNNERQVQQFRTFLEDNAKSILDHDRSKSGMFGALWEGPVDEEPEAQFRQSEQSSGSVDLQAAFFRATSPTATSQTSALNLLIASGWVAETETQRSWYDLGSALRWLRSLLT